MLVSTAQIEVQNTRRISVDTSTTSCLANGGLQRTQSTMPHLVAESLALYFLQQSHCYCSPTWALVLPTGFKMDMLYATPWMIQITTAVPMDILQDRLKCLSFIISRLNLTWLNALCLFLLTAVS